MGQQLKTALRLSFAGQARNRLAGILLVAFVPVWYLLIGAMIPRSGIAFRLRATGTLLIVNNHNLGLITAGLNAITIITGFAVLAAVRRALPFDRRLVLSGYRPGALITAKTVAALSAAVLVGAYAAVIMLAFWRPGGVVAIAIAFILAAATYASLGLLIGVSVPGDLEGFFLIIMIALVDTFLQNPVGNPLANKPILEFFPAYGPTQFAVAGAFHHQAMADMALLSLAWAAGFALLGLIVLRLRMPRRPRTARAGGGRAPGSAAAAGSPPAGADGGIPGKPVTALDRSRVTGDPEN
jgi:ABC-2 type transport system permease protein